jgi:hypothetical protein
MIVLGVLFRLWMELVNRATTIPQDPLSLIIFVGLPLVSVMGLMSGTHQMSRAHSSQQGRFMYRFTAFTAFAASVIYLLIWVSLFFQLR